MLILLNDKINRLTRYFIVLKQKESKAFTKVKWF